MPNSHSNGDIRLFLFNTQTPQTLAFIYLSLFWRMAWWRQVEPDQICFFQGVIEVIGAIKQRGDTTLSLSYTPLWVLRGARVFKNLHLRPLFFLYVFLICIKWKINPSVIPHEHKSTGSFCCRPALSMSLLSKLLLVCPGWKYAKDELIFTATHCLPSHHTV